MDISKQDKSNGQNHLGRRWVIAEVVLILLVFFLYAGGAPPHDDEAHYLGKAKHYWNPAWCEGDHFLESADAHLVFNWTVGWMTIFLPLSAVAWFGRLVTWTLLAWSWQRLSRAVVPRRLVSVLSAAIFLTLLERCDLAGEWVVGGVEAKGFSFVFVFLALEALVSRRWSAVWVLLGIATSQHVLVGGWSMVAAAFAWLVTGKEQRPRLASILPFMLLAVVLSLPGLIPALALSWGADPETTQQANEIYVFQRLPHHLVVHWIIYHRPWYVVRHVALLVSGIALFWALRREKAMQILIRFVAGGIVLAAIGVIIDQATVYHPALSASLLRFYWYRLSDAMLPLGVALGVVLALEKIKIHRPATAQWSFAVVLLLTTASLGTTIYQRQQDPRPGADIQTLPRVAGDSAATMAIYRDWRSVCQWIADNTAPTDRFITPRRQQTFKWYSGRSEVATYKDIPQDAKSIVQWRQRFEDLIVAQSGNEEARRQRLLELAQKYDAQYLVVDRNYSPQPLRFIRVYPNRWEKNVSYEVYRLPPPPHDDSKPTVTP